MHLTLVLGLAIAKDSTAKARTVGLDEEGVADLIQQCQMAQRRTADEIRGRLAAMGIAVVDQPNGEVRWHRQ